MDDKHKELSVAIDKTFIELNNLSNALHNLGSGKLSIETGRKVLEIRAFMRQLGG